MSRHAGQAGVAAGDGRHSAIDEVYEADRACYLETLRALRLLQSFIRRRRWRKMLHAKAIPLIHGPFGLVGWPIFRGAVLTGVEGPSGRQYIGQALGCLGIEHPLRHYAIFVTEWRWFDRVSLLLVSLNSTLLELRFHASDRQPVISPFLLLCIDVLRARLEQRRDRERRDRAVRVGDERLHVVVALDDR